MARVIGEIHPHGVTIKRIGCHVYIDVSGDEVAKYLGGPRFEQQAATRETVTPGGDNEPQLSRDNISTSQ